MESGELEDLFDNTESIGPVEAVDDGDMEDLFIDEPDDDDDGGLEGLL